MKQTSDRIRPQARLTRLDHRRVRKEQAHSQPAFQVIAATEPYLPTIDSFRGGFTQQRVVVRDSMGREVAL